MNVPFGWLGAVQSAWNQTFPYQGDQDISDFEERWGPLDQSTFRDVFREGEGKDKVFAIFALGSLVVPDVFPLLSSVLQSSDRMQRWAAIISLARLKDEQVFPLLQPLLLEGILDYGPLLPEAVPPSDTYIWFNIQRCKVASLLGKWGDPQAVPGLYQAFETCWQLEQQPGPFAGRWGIYRNNWHGYQDQLAYALGQLEAFGALTRLELPSERLRIAAIYLVLGSLGSPVAVSLFNAPFLQLTESQEKQIANVLAQKFGLAANECAYYLQQFMDDIDQRVAIEER